MPKIRKYGPRDGWGGSGYLHYCPACKTKHAFAVEEPFRNGARWTFNGDFERPSFTPSMNISWGPMPSVPVGRPDAGKVHRCHYFITDGRIAYCPDSTHALSGQTVDLPDFDD